MMMLLLAAAACMAVEGEMIRLADFARALPAFAAAETDAPVGFSPAFGAQRMFAGAEVQRLAARYRIELPGAGTVCFVRPSHRLDEPRVKAALLKVLAESGAELELLDFARYDVPEGELEFNRMGLQRTGAGNRTRLWRGRVVYGNRRSFPIWAHVRLALRREGLVATEAIPTGRPIAPGDVKVETLDLDPFEPWPASRPEDVIGRVARRGINAGKPILLSSLGATPLVKRGQDVEVTVRSGAMQLKFLGKAQKTAQKGELITVRNPSSGRVFPAKVAGKGQVAVGAFHENRD